MRTAIVRSARGAQIVVALYVAAGVAWIYAVVDRRGDVGSLGVLILLFAFHIGIGAVVGRWWPLVLPLLLLPLSIPAGSVPGDGDISDAWEIALLFAPALIVAIALGVVLRKLGGLRRARRFSG